MSTHIYIQLGKLGDILNILPVCQSDKLNGLDPTLMVSRKYADILEGVSYVKPLIFEGESHDIEQAVKIAQSTGIPWKCTQVCGPPRATLEYVYKRTAPGTPNGITDSWQKESYRAAGQWGLWRKQPPLVFDKRNLEREMALWKQYCQPRRKAVLLALDGETAPAPHKDLLVELITRRYKGDFQVLDLKGIKAERFYDFQTMFSKARCLVASDSSFLHLARTVPNLPVLALQNDFPTVWHGSAWRPEHVFNCRYSDVANRAMELLFAIEHIGYIGSTKVRLDKPAIIHIWSAYGQRLNDNATQRQSWGRAYRTGNWVETRIDSGAFGRDSAQAPLSDPERYPYVKDAMTAAEMRSKPDDLILWSSNGATFTEQLTADLLWKNPLSYAHQILDGTFVPKLDMFCVPKKWWSEKRKDYPDMVMGSDRYWTNVIKGMIRADGGADLTGVVTNET